MVVQALNLFYFTQTIPSPSSSQFITPVNILTDIFTLLYSGSQDILEQIQNSQQTDILPPEVDYTVAAWKSISVNSSDEKPAVQATYIFCMFPIYPITPLCNSNSVYSMSSFPVPNVFYMSISGKSRVLVKKPFQYI